MVISEENGIRRAKNPCGVLMNIDHFSQMSSSGFISGADGGLFTMLRAAHQFSGALKSSSGKSQSHRWTFSRVLPLSPCCARGRARSVGAEPRCAPEELCEENALEFRKNSRRLQRQEYGPETNKINGGRGISRAGSCWWSRKSQVVKRFSRSSNNRQTCGVLRPGCQWLQRVWWQELHQQPEHQQPEQYLTAARSAPEEARDPRRP